MTLSLKLRLAMATAVLAFTGAAVGQSQTTPTTSTAPAGSTTAPVPAKPSAPAEAAKDPKAGMSTKGTTTPASSGPATAKGTAQPPATGATTSARRERSDRPQPPGRQLQRAYADLMTPEELKAHRAKVKQTRTYAECKALFEATGKEMDARAKAQNKTVKNTPTEICDSAKESGRLTG